LLFPCVLRMALVPSFCNYFCAPSVLVYFTVFLVSYLCSPDFPHSRIASIIHRVGQSQPKVLLKPLCCLSFKNWLATPDPPPCQPNPSLQRHSHFRKHNPPTFPGCYPFFHRLIPSFLSSCIFKTKLLFPPVRPIPALSPRVSPLCFFPLFTNCKKNIKWGKFWALFGGLDGLFLKLFFLLCQSTLFRPATPWLRPFFSRFFYLPPSVSPFFSPLVLLLWITGLTAVPPCVPFLPIVCPDGYRVYITHLFLNLTKRLVCAYLQLNLATPCLPNQLSTPFN